MEFSGVAAVVSSRVGRLAGAEYGLVARASATNLAPTCHYLTFQPFNL